MQNFQGMIFKWIRHLQNFDGKRRGILRIYWVAILTRRPSYQLYFSSFDWSSLDFLLMTSPPCCNLSRKCTSVRYKKKQKGGFPIANHAYCTCTFRFAEVFVFYLSDLVVQITQTYLATSYRWYCLKTEDFWLLSVSFFCFVYSRSNKFWDKFAKTKWINF